MNGAGGDGNTARSARIRSRVGVALSRQRGDLLRSNIGGDLVEDTVDELVAVGAAVRLRQLDGFIDDDLVRNLEAVHELPAADDDERFFDRRQRVRASIEMRRDARNQRIVIVGDARPQFAEIRLIGALMTDACTQIGQDLVLRPAPHLPLVESLHDELARTPPWTNLHRSHPADWRARSLLAPPRNPWCPSARVPALRCR